jgi:hypothetical protein
MPIIDTLLLNNPLANHHNFDIFRMAGGPPGLNQVGVFARANISPRDTPSQHQRGPLHSNKKRALVVDGKTLT